MRIVVCYPPDSSVPMAPFGALPLFQACLKRAGHEVLPLDVSAAVFNWQIRAENVAELFAYLRATAGRSEGCERRLAFPEDLVFGAERAARELRDPALYFQPERMLANWERVYAARELFSFLRPEFDPRSRSFVAALYDHLSRPDEIAERGFEATLRARLRAFDPELVAITVPYGTQIAGAMRLGRWIHASFPGCKVVAGGTGPADLEHELLREPRFYDWIDLACSGDGEEALVGLAQVLGERGELADVPGLHHRAGGRVVPPRHRRLADLDASPTPDFTGLPAEDYLAPERIALMTTSRGCYYGKCTFCKEGFGVNYRRRSSPNVWEDVRAIAREQGISNFMFWDSLTPPGMLHEISARAAEEGLDVNWGAEVKFEPHYADRAYVQTLARGGCSFLQFGFESGVQRVLDAMIKGNDLAEIDVILDVLRDERITVGAFWFIGFPTELEDEARETWRYLARHRDRIAFSGYVGTFGLGSDVPVFAQPDRYGIDIVVTPEGAHTYRRRDGQDWDPTHLHQTFMARNDIRLIQTGAALLYGRRRKALIPELSTHAQVGPPVFVRELREGELAIPARNGFHVAAHGGHAYAFVAGSSVIHELSPEDVELVRAVRRGAGVAELLARGEPWIRERLGRLIDHGVLDREPLRADEMVSAAPLPAALVS